MSMRFRVLLRAAVLSALAVASSVAFGATVIWDGGPSPGLGQNLWSNPAHWNTDTLPTSSDDVVITNVAGVEVELDMDVTVNSITIQSGALWVGTNQVLTVNGASTIESTGALKFHDPSTYTGAGNLTVHANGGIQIFGGTLGGSGTLTINSGGWVSVYAADNSSTISRTTTNAGLIAFEHIAPPKSDFTFSGASLNNTGIIDIKTDYNINPGLGSPIWNNNSGGVIKKSVRGGATEINFPVNNAAGATIEAETGTLALNNGGAVSGAYSISSAATLSLASGTFTTSGSPTLAGPGTFSINSGANLALNAGTFSMSGNPAVSGAGTLSVGGGTLDAGAGVDVTWTNVTLSSGAINGSGAVRVSGTFNWTGGTIAGGGARVLNSGSVPTISCSAADCLLNGATLQVQASATFSASTNELMLSNGANLILDAGTTLSITASGDFLNGGGSASSIISNGTIWKKTNFAVSIMGVPVTLSGTATVDIDTGTLQFGDGANVAAGATLDIDASRTLEVTGGVFLFNSGPVVTPLGPLGGTFKVSSGTLRVPTGITIDLPNVTLQGSGFIDGSGTLILSGTSTWIGGTMGSAAAPGGITRIDSGNTLNVNAVGTSTLTQSRIVLNNGTLNLANSVINLSGSATIENNGTIAKTGGAGTATIHPRVENNNGATVSVSSGSLELDGGGTAGGVYSISGGFLSLLSGTFTMSATATVTGGGTLIVDGATLDAAAGVNVTCPSLWLLSGAITGAGDVHVGFFDWRGGTIAGSGTRELQSTSTISCSGGHCIIDAATLQMNTSATFSATSNSLIFSNAASLVIAGGRTLNITTDGTIVGTGTITNNGTITKSGGAGIRSIGTVLDNNGSVIVTSGGLSLLGNGTHSGSFTMTAPGSMLFDGGAHTIAGGISGTGIMTINGATVTLNSTGNAGGFSMSGGTLGGSGTLTLSNGGTWSGGTMSGSGTTAVAAAKTLTVSGFPTLNGRTLDLGAGAMLDLTSQRLDVAGAANVTGSGTVRVNGGTLRVLTGVTQTIQKLTLTAGVIDGAGDLHVGGNFNWLGGAMAGTGARVLDSGSTPVISCSTGNCVLDGATLQLQAFGTYGASTNALVFSNGASLMLDPGKTLHVTNDGDFLSGSGGGTIVIGGFASGVNACIWKSSTSGTSVINVPVTMSGSFLVEDGTLQVAAGVSVAAAGAIIDYRTGATLEVTGGVFQFNSSSVSFPFNGDFKVSGGTLRVPAGISITMPNVTLEGSGVVDGGGTLILNGTSTWAGGTMGSATAPGGITQINSGHTLNITNAGAKSLTQGRELLNSGTVNYGGAPSLTLSGAGKITNNANFNLTTDGNLNVSGSGTIDNSGTLTKSGGSGTSTIFPTVNSTGTVSATTGTLAFAGAGTSYSNIVSTAPATIAFLAGTHSIAGSIGGTGVLRVSGATVNANSSFTIGTLSVTGGTFTLIAIAGLADAFTMTGGTVNGTGTLTLTNGGSWSGGTVSGGVTVINPATMSLGITAPVTLNNGTLQNDGTLSVSANVAGSGTIANNGTLNAAGTVTIGTVVNNSGQIGTSGALSLTGSGTHSGTFTVTTPGILAFASATHSMGGGGSIGGTGTLTFSGAAATVGVPVNVGALSVTAGTATLDANASADAFTMTGGTLDGSGTLTLNNGGTWSGGTMSGSGTTAIPAAMSLGISAPVTLGRTLQNGGTLTVSGDITGSGTIDNGGTLNAAADLIIGTVLNNSGQVVTSSALSLAGGGTHTGSFTVTTPGSLSFSAGTHSLSGGSIGGSGTLALDGATVTVGSPFTIGTLSVSAGTATLDANGSAGAFTLTGGTLGGSGTLTLTNGGSWSGGTMNGSGETVNPAAKTLSISAPVTLNGRTLQNDGTLTVSGDVTGSGTIENGGTLNAAADITIGVTVNNSGQVATSNALSLSGSGTHTGSFNVTSPGSLSFSSGTHSMSGGSIGGNGTLTFNGATVTVAVPVNVGALNVTAGTATLNANGSADAFTMNGGTLGGSGTLTLTNGGSWSAGTMSGSGSTINPAAMSLGITAPVTLNSRTLQNDGTLIVSGDVTGSGTIDNGGTLNAAADITIGVTVNNSGQVATSAALSLSGSGTHTGSFTVTTPGNLSFPSGTHSMSGGGPINGTGTLTFNGATATVGVPVNVGALNVSAGTATLNANGSADAFTMTGGTLGGSGVLTLTNGGTWSGGAMSGSGTTINLAAETLSISAPVTLNSRTLQNDGTLSVSANVAGSGTIANNGTLDPGANVTIGAAVNNNGQIATSTLLSLAGNGAHNGTFTVTAPGVIDFSGGTQTISGTLAGTGTLRFSGAAVTVNGTWTGMPIEVTGGSAVLNTNGTIPELTLSGGTLTGSGDVIVSGPSIWSGGTIAGSGDLEFDTGATVAMPGTNPVTLARGILNEGTINFTAASNGMLIDGARVRNYGTFDIQSSQSIAATAGTPSFVNGGTLKKSGGEGVMQFGAPLSNSGLVRIESGTMQFGGIYAQSAGRTTVLSSAKLRADTVSLDGGSLTGNGTVAGTVANHATVSPGASPGTLTVSGDYVQSSGGTLEIQLDGTAPGSQYDRLLVSGNVTLGGTLAVSTSNGFTPTPGNAFQIITFGSRTANSTFDVTNGLNGLAPTFSVTDLQLVSTVIIPVAADAAVGVTGPGSTIAGTKVIYTVTVSNSGPDTAANIAVAAIASPGLTFSANSGACVGSFPCNIATLGPGQSATIHSAWNVAPSATGSVQLTVNATSPADPNSSNNSDSAVTNIGTCPDITITAPGEMTTGLTAEATATGFGGAAYHWSIVNGTISRGEGTASIEFIAGEPGTATLAVSVTGGGCSLSATSDVTVKPTCVGTAMPAAPADGTVAADAVVDFAWSVVDDASGYRLWLQQDGAAARNLGTVLGTSFTKIIPPGVYQWFVETLFDGCASHESERRTLTILPAQDCAGREAPQLSAPANETPATSAAIAFSWNAVAQALEYELWLAPAGGVPTLIQTTSGTSYTAVVPPGRLEWYVRAVFGGCASTESAHRVFTYSPPLDCTSERPLLIAPVEGERLTSPVSFEWTGVSGATSYELYVDGVLAATTTSPHASELSLPRAERRWQVRARLGGNCGAVDSAESRLVVVAPSPSCSPLGSPVVSAPAQISSGTAGRLQWSFVAGATAYEVEISADPQFPRGATSSSTVTARQLPITFTNQGSAPVARYVRVHAVDTNCVQPGSGAFSPVAVVSVLPLAGSGTGNKGVALLTDPTDLPYALNIGAELAGQSFTARPTVPWLSVTPASGIVPPGGQTLRAVAHTAGLPAGTSTGDVEITTSAAAAGAWTALASTPPVKTTIAVNNIPGVFTAPKSTPPPDALVIPAVASVTNFIVRYDSDISVTNTSAQVMKYEINFVPTGPAGISDGQKTNVSLEPGATIAMNDIVSTWFGGRTSTGTLEIRPLTEIDTSTSSAAVGGLAQRITFASSRTFSTTAAGGTYGQYVPAVPYANFIAEGSTLSLQHIAQSDKYRTNLGLVEGSGEKVSLEVRIFDAAGTKRASFPFDLNGGERAQLNSVLGEHSVTLDDGRIEVEVISGAGKVTAYASVVDNLTNDPQLVPPVTLDHAGHSKWVMPGVADLASGSGNWQTDVRIFNAGTEPADLTLSFYSMNAGPPTTRTIQLAAGEVRQLDRVLSFFAIAGDAGALHITSAAPAQIVATARTYKQTPDGAYGQFIAAVTPDEAVALGTRPLQILQMEESTRFKSNIGFAEVSGNPVTLEVAIFRPNSTDPALLEVKLEPNQYQQLNSLLASLGLGEMYNARISVRAVGGEGRALAYGSLIDHKTGDPTYIPGQ